MRRGIGWVGVLTLAVALTACGDADGRADSGSTLDPTTATRAERTPSTPVSTTATTTVDSTTAATEARPATTLGSAATVTSDAESIQPAADALDQAAVARLAWMREEEKLARDVYQALSKMWDLPIFANIADSEQTHTDAIGDLLDRYGIQDPMADDVPGVFEDPTIQALHDDLVDQGSQSLVDALIVGATIEDMDIVDLQLRRTGIATIDDVYASLEKGSRNHLRAFIRTLERQGGEYTPSYLTIAEYEAIISSPGERGRSGG